MLQRCSHFAATALLISGLVAGCTSGTPTPAPAAAPTAAEPAAAAPTANAHSTPGEAANSLAAAEATHRITTSVEGSGAERWLVTTVTPGEGYKNNMDYPRWQVQVDETAPFAAGSRVTRDEAVTFEENAVTFRVPLTDATAAGEISGKLRLSVCNDEACLMPTETVRWTVAAAQ